MCNFLKQRRIIIAFVQLFLVCLVTSSACAQDKTDTDTLGKVAEAIIEWDGNSPGDLFKAVKAANPDKAAIVSIRELNKALADKQLTDLQPQASSIIQKQKAAQKAVRDKVFSTREASYAQYKSDSPGKSRSIYGSGDIGSWPTADDPDASMDIDYTVFGVDPNATADLRDQCKKDLLNELVGEESGLTLADFDVVVTAEGHEAAAGVFETEGGIDWAKRNMKRVTIVYQDGTSRTFSLIGSKPSVGPDGKPVTIGDPIGEMANEEHMAKFRELATNNGDYEKLFDEKGNLRTQIFDDPVKKTPMDQKAAQELWNKYMDLLSGFGVDYYVSRTDTATGGCLDMAKHLQEEVITKKHEPKAKLKKTLKYVSRADNISRGVPGLDKLMASDPILGDPAYKDVVDLARQVSTATPDQIDAIIKERFGDMPDAGLQELGNKEKRTILRMSEVAFQAEMDRIILQVPDKSARKAALDKLTDDFSIISNEGGEYSDLARSAVEQISKIQEANEAGTIEAIRKNYTSLEKIRQADQGLIKQATDFLNETELGKKMLDMGGKLLEVGKTPITSAAEPGYKSSSVEFIGEMVDTARAKGLKVMDVAGSVSMWAEVVDNVRTAKSNADLAIALGKTLVNNTFFGMVLNTAYAGVAKGDNEALAKAIMYMLVPESALPALVESLGNTAINIGAQTLFDKQMDKVYAATSFDKDGKISDYSGLGMKGPEGSKYFVDTMCDGAPEEVAQEIISKSIATEFGSGANAIAIKATAKSIRSTVDNGTPLIFKEDGPLMKACAAINQCTQDINDCAKAWQIEVPLSARDKSDIPSGLDIGTSRALLKLIERREQARSEARVALADAMVRTFEERHRAEASLDGGKAQEEFEALKKIFENLGISKEGMASLDAEGAPYNIITNWTTSDREKQIAAVKAVQKFKDAYTTVLQSRSRAESAAQEVLGDGYSPEPRPLTNSLPLTASPELDVQIAKAYLSEVAKAGESTTKDLGLIKKTSLEGSYDDSMIKKLYEVRYKAAYWSAMMKAASDAQQLHWSVEIFDKQALYNKHSQAAAKQQELMKQDTAIQDEFRKHYALEGDYIVELNAPEQIQSGDEAKLSCVIKIKPKDGEAQIVPDDILKQFRYAWASGKVSLGEGSSTEKSYKLDTVGSHQFTVTVTKQESVQGKPQTTKIGQASATIKVVEDSGISVKIEGDSTGIVDEDVPLKAVATSQKNPMPKITFTWLEEAKATGTGETLVFKKKDPGTYSITLKATIDSNGKPQSVGEVIHKIKIENKAAVSVSIIGKDHAEPLEPIEMKADIKADKDILSKLRCVWSDGETSLGEGASIKFTATDEKTHKIKVEVRGLVNGKDEAFAQATLDLAVKTDAIAGGVTASLNGVKSEVAQGASMRVSPGNFSSNSESFVTAEDNDELSYFLDKKWESYWMSENKETDPRAVPKRPAGWGLDTFKLIWHSDPEASFTPKETTNNDAVDVVFPTPGEYTIWADIQQKKSDSFVLAGRTQKAHLTVGKAAFSVALEATATQVKPGESVDILANPLYSEGPYTFKWTGENIATKGAGSNKATFVCRKPGDYQVSVEVTDKKGQKGAATIAISVLAIRATLQGLKDSVVYGTSLPISVKVEGLDKLQQTKKSDPKEKNEDWVLTKIERDDMPVDQIFLDFKIDYNYGDTSFMANMPLTNGPVHVSASWAMPPQRIKPGTELQIPWSIDGHGTKHNDGAGYIQIGTDSNYDNQFYESFLKGSNQGYGATYPVGDENGKEHNLTSGTYRLKFPEGLPGKELTVVVKTTAEFEGDGSRDFASSIRKFVYTFAGENPVEIQPSVKTIWQSEPAITFSPAASMDQKTDAQFDRMDKVKVWAEIQIPKGDNVWESVAETDQQVVTVIPPKFNVTFDPAQGQGKVGTEIKGTVTTDPPIKPDLIDYAWTSPQSSNRMEYEKNASVIGFKLKDTQPLDLECTAKVPKLGEVIDSFKAAYSAGTYTVKADVTGTIGPKPQIWKEGVGLVDIEKGTYGADERVSVKASIEGELAPTDVRWKWSVNDGTSLAGGDTSQEAVITRHETGTAEATVEVTDKNNVLLGKAMASFTVTVSADDIKKSKEKAEVITISLNADKTTAKLGDTVKLSTAVKGGKSPYTYSWTGDATGQGSKATLKADEAGAQDISVTVRDANGKTASKSITIRVQGAFAVKLTSDKTSIQLGEAAGLKAASSGGKAPYSYKWSGTGITGQGASAKFKAVKPGANNLSVVVTDAKKRTVKQSISITVEDLKPVLEGVPEQAMVGTKITAKVTSVGSGVPGMSILWHCDPTVDMTNQQSSQITNVFTLSRLGPINIWAEVLDKDMKSIAKTELKSVEVKAPTFEVSFSKQEDSVTAKLVPDSQIDPQLLDFKWLRPSDIKLGSDPTSAVFKQSGSLPTDILVRIKVRQTSELVQELRVKYEPGVEKSNPTAKDNKPESSDQTAATAKDNKPANDKGDSTQSTTSPKDSDKAKDASNAQDRFIAEQEATAQIDQAKTLAANGKIDESIKLVDKAGKVVPEKAAAARKDISREAVSWSRNAVVDLDFDHAESLVETALKLDPNNDDAKKKQADIRKYSESYKKSEALRPQFDKQIADKKVVSAEKTYKSVNDLIHDIPAASKITPVLNSMSDRLAKARDSQTLALQPHRVKIMDFMKQDAYENALPLCNEVLEGKVVPELYQAQEDECRKWKDICENKIKQRQTQTAKKPAAKTETKPASATKPDEGKKKQNVFDKISGALDKIDTAINGPDNKKQEPETKPNTQSKPVQEPNKPTAVVDIGNTGGCSLTDKSTFKLDSNLRVTQIIIWASWGASEQTVSYNLTDSGGTSIRRGVFTRGEGDAYQKNWCNGVDEPDITLPAGAYTVKLPKAMIGQNSGTGGNGMIKVVTGGLLAPASRPVDTKSKPTAETAPVSKAKSAPKTASEDKPLKPAAITSGCPSGWITKTVGDITVCIPGSWETVRESSDSQAAWYTGNEDTPDAGFGVLREHTVNELISDIDIQNQSSITVSGMPATSYIGKPKSENLIGWLVAVQKAGSDGRPIFFVGVAKPEMWANNRPLLEKILGSVHIKGTKASPKPKQSPKKTAGSKMIDAIFTNQSSQNVHIFVDGGHCEPGNRLVPGETKHVSVKMPSGGRIKFCAGRGGTQIGSATWNGEPDDLNRIPKVIWDSTERLIVVTSLK